MAIRDIFKVSRKTFFNPAAWLDFNAVRAHTILVWTTLANLFTPPRPLREETFEQAMTRLHLTEPDVKSIAQTYRQYAIFFFIIGLLGFCYAFYLLFRYWTFIGFLIGLCMTALFITQAFKYDFWSLQMRKRKLGLTFEDWQKSILGSKR